MLLFCRFVSLMKQEKPHAFREHKRLKADAVQSSSLVETMKEEADTNVDESRI